MLKLLSLLEARHEWPGAALSERLGVSTRTLRRDIDSLRDLGYPVEVSKGPDGGYRMGSGTKLPPLMFDDEQVVAIAVALQTAQTPVSGFDEGAQRALATIKQVMPAHLRAELDALHLTAIRNYWDFSAPPVESTVLKVVGAAVRTQQLLRFDYAINGDAHTEPLDQRCGPRLLVEPHHLVLWAGRWYLVAYVQEQADWQVYRVDRILPCPATGTTFVRRDIPGGNVAQYVSTRHDRGDTPANWQCLGSAKLSLSAGVVAQWAPGGSVVEYVDINQTRITLGAWSWAGIAGILATFDTDLHDVEPLELRSACARLANRFSTAAHQVDALPQRRTENSG